MIDWLTIKHFAIAESVELEFDAGFSAVTGETGSGKSLIVDAIAILLGARGDNSLIKHGHDQAEIQCSFALPPEHTAFSWLERNEFTSDNEILLRRIIRRDKPGRGYINGYPVNFSMLRELGRELVDIHGQHEHHSLVRRSVQQRLLDVVAGNQDRLSKLDQVVQNLTTLKQQLDQLNNHQVATQERMDLLKFQLLELDQLRPAEGEWEELEQQQKRLQHATDLATGCQTAAAGLYQEDGDSVHQLLTKYAGQLHQLERVDEKLGAVALMLEESAVNVEEAARQLQGYAEQEDLDQAQIEEIEQRFTSFHELSRKHRVQPGALAQHTEALRNELSGLNNPEAERLKIESAIDQHQSVYAEVSKQITTARKRTAGRLGKKITGSMQEVGMEGGCLKIHLEPLNENRFSKLGNETVEFMVTANPGMPLQPLSKVASGGEISRISLAIQVILADSAKVPTLIFDEVDVGIGGTVANVVGQRLGQLGNTAQVICVTHLAQVAARADHHFSVSKADPGSNTSSLNVQVRTLDRESRIEEISRMSGSEQITVQSRAHAAQMLGHN